MRTPPGTMSTPPLPPPRHAKSASCRHGPSWYAQVRLAADARIGVVGPKILLHLLAAGPPPQPGSRLLRAATPIRDVIRPVPSRRGPREGRIQRTRPSFARR